MRCFFNNLCRTACAVGVLTLACDLVRAGGLESGGGQPMGQMGRTRTVSGLCAVAGEHREKESPPAALPAASAIYLRRFGALGLHLDLIDHLKRPAFWWPRTLLSYPVAFEVPVKPSQLTLWDEDEDSAIPFQLSREELVGGILKFAVVNFFSDLESGGAHHFHLRASADQRADRPQIVCKEAREGNTIVLNSGKLKVRIPDSRAIASGAPVPGPILAIGHNGDWIGDSRLVSPKRAVKKIVTERVASGPLFIAYRVGYEFANGGHYHATVRAIAGYDYVEFSEEMQGLPKGDGITIDQAWTGFHPTHRSSRGSPAGGTCRIDEPLVNNFLGEDPAFGGPEGIEDPSREMAMKLRPNWPNCWGGNRSVSFWDEDGCAGLGVFIPDVTKWQDHEYSVWSSSDTLLLRFHFANGTLHWTWPLCNGTRMTGISADDSTSANAVDAPALGDQEENTLGSNPVLAPPKLALPVFLSNRYGEISLDRVKDWMLDYPDSAAHPPALSGSGTLDCTRFMEALEKCSVAAIADGLYHPVGLRDLRYWVVPNFNRLSSTMTPAQRESAAAFILLSAYLSAEEELAPLRNSLGGHPHFMADLMYPLLAAAFLFPEHPMAAEWRDQYEKFLELASLFNTRPPQPQWEARGGRWTESIAYYHGAFIEPVLAAERLGFLSDRHNRIPSPALAAMADYLAGTVTAPVRPNATESWQEGIALTPENGFERLHPPQGAHADRRGMPGMLRTLGERLERYRPLVAESLLWAGAPAQTSGSARPAPMVDRGTNPRLTSAKYTGYGIVLRAAVDTPDEISVFLQQIDKGPNYRWGFANEGGCGDIYYYARGKSFSGHGSEDAGDRRTTDAEMTCNTAVYKDKTWRSIGMNELTQPFYNLEVAQFAELLPRKQPDAYSWPEYAGRSVLMAGNDYIVIYDAVGGAAMSRMAWTLLDGKDAMPKIIPLKGENAFTVEATSRGREVAKAQRWEPYVNGGDRMVIVTHKPEVKITEPNRKRKSEAALFPTIETPTSRDTIFEDQKEIAYYTKELVFHGHAGIVRRRADGTTELALFHGARIGTGDIILNVSNPEFGVSVVYGTLPDLKGVCFGRTGATLVLEAGQFLSGNTVLFPPHTVFYLDGKAVSATVAERKLTVQLPPGEHHWEAAAHPPEPLAPAVVRTEIRAGAADLYFTPVAGADRYRLEISRDCGATWQPATGVTLKAPDCFTLNHLQDGVKIHARVIAGNESQESRPSRDYPVCPTPTPPPAPDGLKVELSLKRAKLTWGELLGVTEYRLYRRERPVGTDARSEFKQVYHGLATGFNDQPAECVPPAAEPGVQANALKPPPVRVIYEYAVAAVNGNGEGEKSALADTDPASWRNWMPPGIDLKFRRQTAFWLPPYVLPNQTPEPYPDGQ